MTFRIPATIAASACLLASPAMTGTGSAAGTCADEVRSLTEIMDTTNAKRAELERESVADNGNPLIVTMADGSTVDLRNDAPAARPYENWFGESIKVKDVEVRIVEVRTMAEEQSDDACLSDLEKIQAWFDEIRGSGTAK